MIVNRMVKHDLYFAPIALLPPNSTSTLYSPPFDFRYKTQAVCYVGLWYVSGNHPPADGEDSGEEENPSNTSDAAEHNSPSETPFEYSILAIAGAMYLILSIEAADVWNGAALIVEGRGPGFVLFTRRRIFGVFLLATFCTLLGASIRELFYSSKKT